jgi:hypothetical protein
MRRRERRRNVSVRMESLPSFYLTLSTAAAPSLPGGDDPSAKMWSLSISQFSEHDAAMAERWKNDMDGILIYVRSTWFIGYCNPINVSGTFSRQVSSPRRLPHFSSTATSYSSPIPPTCPPDFFNKSRRNSLASPTVIDSPLRPLTRFGPRDMRFM